MPTAPEPTAAEGTRTGLLTVHERGTGSNGRLLSLWMAIIKSRTLPAVLFLVALLAIAVNMSLILEVGGNYGPVIGAGNPESGISDGPSPTSDTAGGYNLRNGLILLLVVIVVSFGAILFLFAKRFVKPLNEITTVVRQMADGDLSSSVPEELPDDMKALGQAVQDLGVNFQEVLLFTGTTVGALSSAVDRIEADMESNPVPMEQLKEDLHDVKADLEMLASVLDDFEFYKTRFNGRDVLSEFPKSDRWEAGDKKG